MKNEVISIDSLDTISGPVNLESLYGSPEAHSIPLEDHSSDVSRPQDTYAAHQRAVAGGEVLGAFWTLARSLLHVLKEHDLGGESDI